jgi:hypothetical protein
MLAFYLVSYTSAEFSDKLKSFCLLLLCIFQCSTSHLLQHKELTEIGLCQIPKTKVPSCDDLELWLEVNSTSSFFPGSSLCYSGDS